MKNLLISHFLHNFVPMKQEKNMKTQKEVFREKVDHYEVCFIDHCPLREQCLRWLVGQYADTTRVMFTTINQRNPMYGNEHCEMRGFKNMYHDMPGYMERRIRWQLIASFGRRIYFEMRKGDRLITPAQQQTILNVCRANGWQGPINYDGEQEDWLW